MIEDNKEHELKTIKEKYIIAKTTLEAVLWYIVPDKCREIINEALNQLNDKTLK